MDALANGRRIKYLTVVDDYSGECVGIATESGIGGQYVTHVLDQVGLLKTGCGRSDWAGECRPAPIPDVSQFPGRLSAVPGNLAFGGSRARRSVSGSTAKNDQRLLPLATIAR
jgi:hypothetical protein